MLKKILSFSLVPLLLAGCSANFTNLSPQRQVRNPNNLYPVEVALATRQQTLRWESIKASVVVGADSYPMRPTLLMTNRWEGLLPAPAGTKAVEYRYKFDFNYNAFGGPPKSDSAYSPKQTLQILDR